jgi:hypothetical protein
MFSHVHKKTARPNYEQQHQVAAPVKMQFAYRQFHAKPVQPQVVVKQEVDPLPKMKWGRPIWTFFHVTAQKIKPEYFGLIIKDYLNFIGLICGTLPCPICSAHASEYMRSINVNNIRCREDLIQLFYNFHNVVNQRKGYAVLQKDQIPQYETANTVGIIKDFIRAYEDKSRAMKLMADDLSRSRISNQFKSWINANIQYFEP